ncbi:hypothetical protein FACS1894164_05070 [Spirochaetia bacterium]|nr:hypothetical protein FACS1894164_05070 [Spirochaetia bacterium]
MEQFEGDHISVRIESRNRIRIRNKDNICSATIAYNQTKFGAAKICNLFMDSVVKEMTFENALNFFERHNIKMFVSG